MSSPFSSSVLEHYLTTVIVVVGFLGACIVVCLARGPRETGWIGWGGGWKITRDDLPPKNADSPGPTELEMALDEAAGVQDDNSATGNPHPLESEKLKV